MDDAEAAPSPAARFPVRRMRRLRRTPALRRLVAETTPGVDDLVAPLFVREGIDEPVPIASMPGHAQHTVAVARGRGQAPGLAGGPRRGALRGARPQRRHRIGGVGPRRHRPGGAGRAARAPSATQLVLIADLCLDEYTDHGHCGVLRADGTVDNDATVELYQRWRVAQAARAPTWWPRAG